MSDGKRRDTINGLDQSTDALADDLKEILDDAKIAELEDDESITHLAYIVDKDLLMQKLVSYIVRRDHKVFNHAYTVGKKAV